MHIAKWSICVVASVIAQVYCLLASMIIVHEIARIALEMWGPGLYHIGAVIFSGLCCVGFNLLVMDMVLWSWLALKNITTGTDSIDKEGIDNG